MKTNTSKIAKVFTLTLLLVCMLSMSVTIPLVQADKGGEGKYLQVDIIGDPLAKVVALKVQSGQEWTFTPTNNLEKVGAGIVQLTAIASPGYQFVKWIGDVTFTNDPTVVLYKAVKYGIVTAEFD
jgi:hypothetical protein